MHAGSKDPMERHHRHWYVWVWLAVACVLLFGLGSFTSFAWFEGIDLREYKGLLLPALAIGLGIAFATVYVKFDAALDEGEANRAKLRTEVQEAIQRFEKLRE